MSMVAGLAALFQWIVIGSRTSSRGLRARRSSSRPLSRQAAPCARNGAQLLPDNRVRRPDQLGLRDVAVEDQPLQDAAELGVAFLVAAQIGRRSSRTCPSCRGCRAAEGRTAARRSGTSSGGKVTGTVSMLERTPALPAVTQNEVPPRIDCDLRPRTGNVVEDEARRLARAPCRDRAGRWRVADQEVVDVVLARVHAGRERGPRRRRLRRVRRAERRRRCRLRELLHVRQLAFVHPLLDELRVHAVEAEDDELLLELLRRPAAVRTRAAARETRATSEATRMRFTRRFARRNYTIWRVGDLVTGAFSRWTSARAVSAWRSATRLARWRGRWRRSASAAKPMPWSGVARRIGQLDAEDEGIAAVVVGLPSTPRRRARRCRPARCAPFIASLQTRTRSRSSPRTNG